MAKPLSEGMQLLVELVGTAHWDYLKREAHDYADTLALQALVPAANPMDFYTKEGAARAAREITTFFSIIEYSVRDATSDTDIDTEEWGA